MTDPKNDCPACTTEEDCMTDQPQQGAEYEKEVRRIYKRVFTLPESVAVSVLSEELAKRDREHQGQLARCSHCNSIMCEDCEPDGKCGLCNLEHHTAPECGEWAKSKRRAESAESQLSRLKAAAQELLAVCDCEAQKEKAELRSILNCLVVEPIEEKKEKNNG